MYSPSMKFRSPSAVEPLESRIAPAVIFVGSPGLASNNPYDLNPSDPTVTDTPFHAVSDNASFAAAMSATNGDGTFYISLHKGDVIKLFNASQYIPFITVTAGNVVAFFHDINGNHQVDVNELTGLALGKNVSIKVAGGVYGDIATNLNDDGSLTLNPDGLNPYAIQSLAVSGGSIFGNVLSGGNINKLSVSGNVNNVLAGSAANGFNYDFNNTVAGGGQTLSVTADGNGPSIKNVTVTGLGVINTTDMSHNPFNNPVGVLQAGDGANGGAGGSLSNITIGADTNGFTLQAGNGGDGTADHAAGGNGGSITTVYVNGPAASNSGNADTTDNDPVSILAGSGGNGASATAKGGAGGSLKSVYIGYKFSQNGPKVSDDFLRDDILLQAGDGGDGGNAGAGGSVKNSLITVTTPDDSVVINEVQVIAGTGGSTVDGKAGLGGSIINITARNLNVTPSEAQTADISLEAGNGGGVTGAGAGADGGAVKTITFVGDQIAAIAGDGSTGSKQGGNGGSVTAINISNATSGVINNSAILTAGRGGDTTNGKAGNGGSVNNLTALDANFADSNFADLIFEGLIVTGGDGGSSTNGKAGNGGGVSSFTVTDQLGGEGYFTATAGSGGDGLAKAGNGGGISSINFSGNSDNVIAKAGNGGNSVNGKGGNGGAFNGNAFSSLGSVNALSSSIVLTAGGGGASTNSSGGAGGGINNTNSIAAGNASSTSGMGGAGSNLSGNAGSGGSITNSSLQAQSGDASLIAGDAGASGAKAGKGGSISNSNVLGEFDVTIHSGNGASGGAGGNLKSVAFSGSTIGTSPLLNVDVKAGDGSAVGSVAGAGGSINDMTGYVADFGTTVIQAGSSLGSATVGGVGGSISNLTFLGGGSSSAELSIMAGNASDATSANKGANGGSVSNVNVLGSNGGSSGIDEGVIFRNIVAGNGGDALQKGGNGGSVLNIHVTNHDIGVMSGETYGYATMGGIFAGLGGGGLDAAGLNGNVEQVTAHAIASIVAGTGGSPGLVNIVDRIFLTGNTAPTFNGSGAYTNLDSANMVGGVNDPSRADASEFQYLDGTNALQTNSADSFVWNPAYKPVDGLIAAKTLTANHNFTPGAVLTLDPQGTLTLFDPKTV